MMMTFVAPPEAPPPATQMSPPRMRAVGVAPSRIALVRACPKRIAAAVRV